MCCRFMCQKTKCVTMRERCCQRMHHCRWLNAHDMHVCSWSVMTSYIITSSLCHYYITTTTLSQKGRPYGSGLPCGAFTTEKEGHLKIKIMFLSLLCFWNYQLCSEAMLQIFTYYAPIMLCKTQGITILQNLFSCHLAVGSIFSQASLC